MKKYFIITAAVVLLSITIIIYSNIKQKRETRQTIFSRIESIEDLVTAKQTYREILYSKESSKFLGLSLSNKEFLISVEYIITAGIDLSKGYNVEEVEGRTIITLPKAEVLSIDADDATIKEYFVKQRFSDLYREDYFTLIQESKENILSGDNIDTLLKESETSAEQSLTTLLKLSGIDAEIKFSNSIIRRLN